MCSSHETRMTTRTEAKPDEKFALELLNDHLTMSGISGFQSAVHAEDPPDLVVNWNDGAQWGVEVTRAYRQVAWFDGGEPVSSEQMNATLRNIGKQLGKKTIDIRKRSYTLHLEGPGPFSSWKMPDSMKSWKEKTEDVIQQHIESEESGILKIPGVWLKPSEPGNRWTITTGSGVAEMSSSTATTLRRALGKSKDLQKWNGRFDERWLLLLNCYPLVDDIAAVEDRLRQLVRKNEVLAGFNGIFWSGYPDRTLTPISLSSSLERPTSRRGEHEEMSEGAGSKSG